MKKKLLLASILFITLALFATLSYLVQKSFQTPLLGCSHTGDSCDLVSKSHWAYVLHLPIIYLGGITYLSLLLSLYLSRWRQTRYLSYYLSILILTGALWFISIQALILHHYCLQCCLIHALASTGCILYLLQHRGPKKKKLCIAAISTVACLALTQSLFPSSPSSSGSQRETPLKGGIQLNTITNVITLYQGALSLDETALPVLINSTKSLPALYLSDYTCPHCLSLHISLLEHSSELANQGTLYHLPAYQTADSKELSRILIIVGRVDKNIYHDLLRQLHAGNLSTSPSDMRTLADKKLNGKYMLYYQSFYPWSERVLQASQQLMQLNQERAQAYVYPQLLIGNKLIEGSFSISDYKELERNPSTKEITNTKSKPLTNSTSKLIFNENAFDLGVITRNQYGNAVLHIKNPTKQTVYINNIKTSCGCLTLQSKPSSIPAGETASLPFRFSTKKFFGPVTHNILIYEQGTQRPSVIPVKVDVWLPFRAYPYNNQLGKVAEGTSTQLKKINLIKTTEQPVYLKLLPPHETFIDAELITIIKGTHYELNYKINAMPPKSVKTSLILKTTHPKCPEITIPLSATTAAPYEVLPSSIPAEYTNTTEAAKFTIRCYDQSIATPKILNIHYKGSQQATVTLRAIPKTRPNQTPQFTALFNKSFNLEQALKSNETIEVLTNFCKDPIQIDFNPSSE